MQRRPVLLTISAGPFHMAQETELPDNPRNIWRPRIDLNCEAGLAPSGRSGCGP